MPPDPPPVPILATWTNPNCFVTFDQVLGPGVLDNANWFVRVGNFSRGVATATVVPPSVVRLTTVGFGPDAGPDIVSYSPPPFDVIGSGGPAVAFADYPIT